MKKIKGTTVFFICWGLAIVLMVAMLALNTAL